MKNEVAKIGISSEEVGIVSNKGTIEFARAEFIRDQMVKLIADGETELNITESDQYSNSNSLSISSIRKKMIYG